MGYQSSESELMLSDIVLCCISFISARVRVRPSRMPNHWLMTLHVGQGAIVICTSPLGSSSG